MSLPETVFSSADAVFAVAWNPAQSDMVASGGGDDMAYIWKVQYCCESNEAQLKLCPKLA